MTEETRAAEGEGAGPGAPAWHGFAGPRDGGPDLLTDPAGYALAWSPGLQAAVAACEDSAAAAELLIGAQAALGIPEGRRSPWTQAECEALVGKVGVRRWRASPEGWVPCSPYPRAAWSRR